MNDQITTTYTIIVIIIGLVILYFYNSSKKTKERIARVQGILENLKQYKSSTETAIEEFNSLLNQELYLNNKKFQSWVDKYQFLKEAIPNDVFDIDINNEYQQNIFKFFNYFSKGREYIDQHNEEFIIQELPIAKKILDDLAIENNEEQLRAIVCDEDNNLIIAGAGTGKTTTIVGKVAYLIYRKNIKPEKLLLLVFGKKASEELEQKVLGKFGDHIMVKTFHAFGKDIIGKVEGKSPDVAFGDDNDTDLPGFIDDKFNDLLINNDQYLKLAIDYFAYYFNEVELIPSFNTLDEYYKYRKSQKIITIKKERVKSYQESELANFLYLHNINYKYEPDYEHDTRDPIHRQYKPDFYLPDYQLYLEHFGIDRQGKVKYTNNEAINERESRKYQENIKWKHEIHKHYKTNLIETFSYEFFENNWKENLFSNLAKFNVAIDEKSQEEILNKLKEGKDIKQMSDLFCTFLNLLKSGGFITYDLYQNSLEQKLIRNQVFLELFEPIFQVYKNFITDPDNGLIDFNDMLIKAADYLNKNKYQTNYKYILVDEFQDTSISRFNLLKAILNQNQDSKIFGVGDDWQSIFRFAGADVSLMTDFKNYFGFTKENKLETTHRFNEESANITNEFIRKNPYQLKKQVKSSWKLNSRPIQIFYKENQDDNSSLELILNNLNQYASQNNLKYKIYLLGRYSHNKPLDFNLLESKYKSLNIEFFTVHKVKGKQADFVIILDVTSGRYGFPSEIADDPVLNMVLSKSDSFPYSEERRVMYVALTRAKYKTFIIADKRYKSIFINELESYYNDELPKCPWCEGKLIIEESRYGGLWERCSNFPDCEFKLNYSRGPITNQSNFNQPIIPSANISEIIISQAKQGNVLTPKKFSWAAPYGYEEKNKNLDPEIDVSKLKTGEKIAIGEIGEESIDTLIDKVMNPKRYAKKINSDESFKSLMKTEIDEIDQEIFDAINEDAAKEPLFNEELNLNGYQSYEFIDDLKSHDGNLYDKEHINTEENSITPELQDKINKLLEYNNDNIDNILVDMSNSDLIEIKDYPIFEESLRERLNNTLYERFNIHKENNDIEYDDYYGYDDKEAEYQRYLEEWGEYEEFFIEEDDKEDEEDDEIEEDIEKDIEEEEEEEEDDDNISSGGISPQNNINIRSEFSDPDIRYW